MVLVRLNQNQPMDLSLSTPPVMSLDRYLPAPKNGQHCPVSGMGHARFYTKVINGEGRNHVRIVDMKEPNQSRGTKFYHAGDLLSWLNSIAERPLRTSGDGGEQVFDAANDGACMEGDLLRNPKNVKKGKRYSLKSAGNKPRAIKLPKSDGKGSGH